MAYDGPDRRRDGNDYDGPERRHYLRRMTDDELQEEVHDLRGRVEALEEVHDRLQKLPDAVAELTGTVKTLTTMVTSRFDHVDQGVDRASGIKTAITFASVVIVPILIALIGGYFALRSGAGTK